MGAIARVAFRIPTSSAVIISTGKFSHQKGSFAMMTGFLHGRGYKNSFKDVVFVGDVERKYWEALRIQYLELRTDARLSRQTRFHLVGSIISEKAMREYYGIANFTVLNSNCEAFGRGILESFAHGIPALARGCGGPAEIIKHGKTGFFFRQMLSSCCM
eukprot:jgi/Picre1/27035/NNA_000005.t1